MTDEENAAVQELHRTIHRLTQTNHNLRQGMRKAFKSHNPTTEFLEQFFAQAAELEACKQRLLKATRDTFQVKMELHQMTKERDKYREECHEWRQQLRKDNDERLANR